VDSPHTVDAAAEGTQRDVAGSGGGRERDVGHFAADQVGDFGARRERGPVIVFTCIGHRRRPRLLCVVPVTVGRREVGAVLGITRQPAWEAVLKGLPGDVIARAPWLADPQLTVARGGSLRGQFALDDLVRGGRRQVRSDAHEPRPRLR